MLLRSASSAFHRPGYRARLGRGGGLQQARGEVGQGAGFVAQELSGHQLHGIGETVGEGLGAGGGGAASLRVETSGLAPSLYTLRLHDGGPALARRVPVE